MPAPGVVNDLVERFTRQREAYRSPDYKEAQLRQEFINPFFDALGWDVYNRQGFAEQYKDVIHEDAVKIGGYSKAPDYSFRLGGRRVFFVETKRPSVNLKENPEPAHQLRRYAWSAKLPLSILTDFEEFAVYDCRTRPTPKDKVTTGRLDYLSYQQYSDAWDRIAGVFSRDAVLKGLFDQYANKTVPKKGTAEVDQVFLRQIESWRDVLAKNLALRNRRLSLAELNFSVQAILDRIIFLRISEDRGIETYEQLHALLNGGQVYERLCELFERADERYNSGLFHFNEERSRQEPPDRLTLTLRVEDNVIKDIVAGLYPPQSPYEFSVLPADILGQVYEQFLGKVIRLTAGHQAKVEYKPEIKKAGGVFYTPTYVVEHIVKETVGRLLDGKTIKQAAKLRILDPACGSGSFLIVAYQYLLDWHRDQYVERGPEKHRDEIYQGPGGLWRLSTAERKRILVSNIYGVDIDPQAVEVTKLSLLLKVLEGESQETIQKTLRLFNERALPDLGNNIKCGNSIIDPTFYHDAQIDLLEDESRRRVNAFDWQAEYPSIFGGADPGFDAIIGNPPYIPTELMTEAEGRYYQQHYPQLEGKYDTSVIFILASLPRLRSNGRLGFISSVTWQTGENYAKTRQHIFAQYGLEELVNLPFDVFKEAYVDTGVYVLTRTRQPTYRVYQFPKRARVTSLEGITFAQVPRELIGPPTFKIVLDAGANALLARVLRRPRMVPLGDFTKSTQGLAGNRFSRVRKAKGSASFPFLEEGQVYRYSLAVEATTYTSLKDKPSLEVFYEAAPKLLIRRVVNRQDRLMAAYTDRRMVFKKDVNPFVLSDDTWDPFYVLAILNSHLVSYLYVKTSSIATKDDFRQTTLAELRRIPVHRFDPKDHRHKEISELARSITERHEQLARARTAHEQQALQRQIDAFDQRIDELVNEIYQVTDDELHAVTGEPVNPLGPKPALRLVARPRRPPAGRTRPS